MTDRSDESPAEPRPILKLTPTTLDELRARYEDEEDDEPLGGDPPCWAHLFEDEPDPETGS